MFQTKSNKALHYLLGQEVLVVVGEVPEEAGEKIVYLAAYLHRYLIYQIPLGQAIFPSAH